MKARWHPLDEWCQTQFRANLVRILGVAWLWRPVATEKHVEGKRAEQDVVLVKRRRANDTPAPGRLPHRRQVGPAEGDPAGVRDTKAAQERDKSRLAAAG